MIGLLNLAFVTVAFLLSRFAPMKVWKIILGYTIAILSAILAFALPWVVLISWPALVLLIGYTHWKDLAVDAYKGSVAMLTSTKLNILVDVRIIVPNGTKTVTVEKSGRKTGVYKCFDAEGNIIETGSFESEFSVEDRSWDF